MKHIVLSLMFAGAIGAAAAASAMPWTRASDARPEAVVTGATLLAAAALIRRGARDHRSKEGS